MIRNLDLDTITTILLANISIFYTINIDIDAGSIYSYNPSNIFARARLV